MSYQLTATVCWMDSIQLTIRGKYIIQHRVNKVLAKVDKIHPKINPDYSGINTNIKALGMNDLTSVSFKLNKPIFYDAFEKHRTNGSFILIDLQSNNTVGAGFIK